MFRNIFTCVIVTASTLVAGTRCRGEVIRHYKILAITGGPASSVGPNVQIGRIDSRPRISQGGHVVFSTLLVNNGTLNKAIWSGLPGAFEVVALHGAPAPGRSGETLNLNAPLTVSSHAVCDDGSVAFLAKAAPSGDDGVWMGHGGILQKVMAVNDVLPFSSGVQVREFKNIPFVVNGAGQIVLRAILKGVEITNGNDTALWAGSAGDLGMLHLEGRGASPFTGGLKLGDVSFSDLSMNANGELAFEVLDQTLGVRGDNNSVLMTGTRQGLQLRLREGDPVPGNPAVVWGNFERPQLANDGTVTFFSNPNTSAPGRYGIQHSDGSVEILATHGAEAVGAPGLQWDIPLNRFPFNTPMLGGGGTTAFVAGLGLQEDFYRDGIWIYQQRELQLVARKFQPAPGDPGETFLEIGGMSFGEGPGVTEDGVVVFWSETSARKRGFWRWHAGDLQPLILEGDLIDWGNGETKSLIAVSAKLGGAGQSGEPSGLNDRGQLVMNVFLSGGIDAVLMIDNVMDRDGDGVECLLEEAFGGNPDDPSDGRSLLPVGRSGDGMFTMSFLQRDDGSFNYQLEHSMDLKNWTPIERTLSPSSEQASVPVGTTLMHMSAPIEIGQRYFRVGVTRVSAL